MRILTKCFPPLWLLCIMSHVLALSLSLSTTLTNGTPSPECVLRSYFSNKHGPSRAGWQDISLKYEAHQGHIPSNSFSVLHQILLSCGLRITYQLTPIG